MIELIDNVENPVVGKTYYVKCGLLTHKISGFKKGGWVPLLGDIHSDAELRTDFPHYHYDFRFIRSIDNISPSAAIAVMLRANQEFIVPIRETKYLRRKLWRLTSKSPYLCQELKEDIDRIGKELRCTNGTCPHRGVKLTSIPSIDGIKTCPAHYMRWGAHGEYVPYCD